MSSIHEASPLQLAELVRHRDRMRRIADKARCQEEPAPEAVKPVHEPPTPQEVIALLPDEPTATPPNAKHVPWFEDTVITVEKVKRAVAKDYNLTSRDLESERRAASVVFPRQVAMYLSKMLTTRSFPHIGRRFGGRDHTTAIHAVRKIERLIQSDPDLAARVRAISVSLGAEA